ncbi:MAG: hypothetical protein M3N29_06880 [Chloroflexota bacterium]|nr:hypothetical protein [Chloroflexota bacterium]
MPNTSSPTAPARHPGLFSTLALLGLLAACSSAPPTASPRVTPEGSPGVPLTPTSGPTSTPAASTTAPASPTTGAISHPTGAREVVLRMEVGGGFMPLGFLVTQAPQFTLYGDGTVIFQPSTDMVDPAREGLPRFVQGLLDRDGVQALLAFALGPGRLLAAREHYGQDTCADCPTTIFTLNAAGMAKTVTVDALGMVEPTGPDGEARRGLAALAETLAGFDARAREGELGEATLYDPTHYRVFLLEGAGDPAHVLDWPWDDVTPDDFAAEGEDWRRRLVLDREHVAAVAEVPNGGVPHIYVVDDAGTLWEIGVRPLLPDELAGEGLD